jgi:Sec-independent protein secretion pathway component TatC
MNTRMQTNGSEDMRGKLSALWVVVMFNMAFADILTFIKPGALQELWSGQAGVQVTPGVLLAFAILLEVPIAMIFLSRVLKPAPNRWANTVAAVITTVFVVGGGSLTPHYVFFAAVEIACMGLIVWSVWSRRDRQADRSGSLRSPFVGDASGGTQ